MTDFKFTPEMFPFWIENAVTNGRVRVAEIAQAQLDKWLSNAQRVYGRGVDGIVDEFFWSDRLHSAKDWKQDTHQALLIKIEPIAKPCDHPIDKIDVSTFINMSDVKQYYSKCGLCGKKVRPVGFKAVE